MKSLLALSSFQFLNGLGTSLLLSRVKNLITGNGRTWFLYSKWRVLTQHIWEFLQVTLGPFPDFLVGPGDEARLRQTPHVLLMIQSMRRYNSQKLYYSLQRLNGRLLSFASSVMAISLCWIVLCYHWLSYLTCSKALTGWRVLCFWEQKPGKRLDPFCLVGNLTSKPPPMWCQIQENLVWSTSKWE